MTLSVLFLFSTSVYSKKHPFDFNKFIDVTFRIELIKLMLTIPGTYPDNLSCDLAERIKNNEDIITNNHQFNAYSIDSVIDLIELSKEVNEKCIVMSSFKKNILPIMRDGNLTATLNEDYDLTKAPQFLRIKLVNIENEHLNKLDKCFIKASIFVGENKNVSAGTHELECQISSYKVTFPMISSFDVADTISCVKYIEYLPELIQPCKKLIIFKNKKISLRLVNGREDDVFSHPEIIKI